MQYSEKKFWPRKKNIDKKKMAKNEKCHNSLKKRYFLNLLKNIENTDKVRLVRNFL